MLGETDDNLEFHIHIMWCAQALYHAISNFEMSLLLYASCDR